MTILSRCTLCNASYDARGAIHVCGTKEKEEIAPATSQEVGHWNDLLGRDTDWSESTVEKLLLLGREQRLEIQRWRHDNKEQERRIHALEKEVLVSDKLIAERNRILDADPCPVHGQCVPHILERLSTHILPEPTVDIEISEVIREINETTKEALRLFKSAYRSP